jgi:hypothetical protein
MSRGFSLKLTAFNCQYCGAPLELEENGILADCQYCKSQHETSRKDGNISEEITGRVEQIESESEITKMANRLDDIDECLKSLGNTFMNMVIKGEHPSELRRHVGIAFDKIPGHNLSFHKTYNDAVRLIEKEYDNKSLVEKLSSSKPNAQELEEDALRNCISVLDSELRKEADALYDKIVSSDWFKIGNEYKCNNIFMDIPEGTLIIRKNGLIEKDTEDYEEFKNRVICYFVPGFSKADIFIKLVGGELRGSTSIKHFMNSTSKL